jgi:predicted dehydrogenase
MKKVLLIGTGEMAISYFYVLKELDVEITVIGRGTKSSQLFSTKTSFQAIPGGIEAYLDNNHSNIDTKNLFAIVATGTEALMPVMKTLLNYNITNILVEKPAAISIDELIENQNIFNDLSSTIFVAYNRRFYASVQKVKELIEEDGGTVSFSFDFTEWSHEIETLKKADGVKESWFFANSTHVVDTAFYLGGIPKEMVNFSKKGNLTWHEKSVFSGAGVTIDNALFSYISNWESAGRWGIEINTSKRRFYLRPLEEIKVQIKGSIAIENLIFDNSLDLKYKPGLYNQVVSFLNLDLNSPLLSIKDHINIVKSIYNNIIL